MFGVVDRSKGIDREGAALSAGIIGCELLEKHHSTALARIDAYLLAKRVIRVNSRVGQARLIFVNSVKFVVVHSSDGLPRHFLADFMTVGFDTGAQGGNEFLEANFLADAFEFYMFSLSRHRDDRQQWLEYGDKGRGFAIKIEETVRRV